MDPIMDPPHLDAVVIHRHAGPGVAVDPRRLQVAFPQGLTPTTKPTKDEVKDIEKSMIILQMIMDK
jgi:hypothetical protein